jgi:hypothetical protein
MTGRSGLTDERPTDGRGSRRVLAVAVLALAVGPAAVLVLSNDARWLRMGVVAALWCALVGAVAAAKYRRTAADRADKAIELQALYKQELERECAARREHELELEAETRRRVEEDSREELEALRAELRTLREHLHVLLGGEVLVERVALRAESTRMRSLPESSRLIAAGGNGAINYGDSRMPRLTAGPGTSQQNRPSGGAANPTESVRLPTYRGRQEPPRQQDGRGTPAPEYMPPVQPPVAGRRTHQTPQPHPAAPYPAAPRAAVSRPAYPRHGTAQSFDGGRRAADDVPVVEAPHVQPHQAEPEDATSGAHSAGRSVTELLAALGERGAQPRRRRRAD